MKKYFLIVITGGVAIILYVLFSIVSSYLIPKHDAKVAYAVYINEYFYKDELTYEVNYHFKPDWFEVYGLDNDTKVKFEIYPNETLDGYDGLIFRWNLDEATEEQREALTKKYDKRMTHKGNMIAKENIG